MWCFNRPETNSLEEHSMEGLISVVGKDRDREDNNLNDKENKTVDEMLIFGVDNVENTGVVVGKNTLISPRLASYRSTKSAPVLRANDINGDDRNNDNYENESKSARTETSPSTSTATTATTTTTPSVSGKERKDTAGKLGMRTAQSTLGITTSLPSTMSVDYFRSFPAIESGYGRLSKVLLAVRSVVSGLDGWMDGWICGLSFLFIFNSLLRTFKAVRDRDFPAREFFSSLSDSDYDCVDRFEAKGYSSHSLSLSSFITNSSLSCEVPTMNQTK